MSLADASSTIPSQNNVSTLDIEVGIKVSHTSHNQEESIDISHAKNRRSHSGSFFTARNT